MKLDKEIAKMKHALSSLRQTLNDTELNLQVDGISSEEMLDIFIEYRDSCLKRVKELEEVQHSLQSLKL